MNALGIRGVGVIAPGLFGWDEACAVLGGGRAYAPGVIPRLVPELLPAIERRRSSDSARLAISVAEQAVSFSGIEPSGLVSVFSSSIGDPAILHNLGEELATPTPMVSPTRFHNSVHNAPAGYWSIATAAMGATTSLAAYDASFSAGLLETVAQSISEQTAVLLVCYDMPYPQPLSACRTIADTFAVAMILEPLRPHPPLGSIGVELAPASVSPTPMADERLERMRVGNPAARCLPLLQLMARTQDGTLTLAHNRCLGLKVTYQAHAG